MKSEGSEACNPSAVGRPGSSSAGATMTAYHRPGGCNNRNGFPHSSGAWRSNLKVPEGLLPGESSPLRGQTDTFSLGALMTSSRCSCAESKLTGIPFLKDTNEFGPTFTSFHLHYSLLQT